MRRAAARPGDAVPADVGAWRTLARCARRRWQVVGRPAGGDVAVGDLLVDRLHPGVAQVGAHARPRGQPAAPGDVGLDEVPRAVADGSDRLARLDEVPDDRWRSGRTSGPAAWPGGPPGEQQPARWPVVRRDGDQVGRRRLVERRHCDGATAQHRLQALMFGCRTPVSWIALRRPVRLWMRRSSTGGPAPTGRRGRGCCRARPPLPMRLRRRCHAGPCRTRGETSPRSRRSRGGTAPR